MVKNHENLVTPRRIPRNDEFDARGTLAPLARAKIFFQCDETHMYDRVFNYEQNEPKYGLLS